MSSGQRPRWRAYFPHMKVRGRRRRRPGQIILWQDGKALWPNPFHPKRGRPRATISVTIRRNSTGGGFARVFIPGRGPFWTDTERHDGDE